MFVALLAGLSAQAAPPVAHSALAAPMLSAQFTLAEPSMRYDALPAVPRQQSGELGWFATGLLLAGGGGVVMVTSAGVMSMTENRVVDTAFSWVGLFGALHFVVGASMIGLELTEGRSAHVFFTGNGLAGRF
jgi:hypothetical protein